jgi:hypothetical protein
VVAFDVITDHCLDDGEPRIPLLLAIFPAEAFC